jgi:hypothetical protein
MIAAALRAGAAVAVLLLATGCAQLKLGAPAPSIDNVQKAKASHMAPAQLGRFALADGKPQAMDLGLDVRSNTVSSPVEGSFAQYLKETLAVELKAAGLYDAASPLVLEGRLTDSRLEVPMSEGKARVAARFTLRRNARALYDKELVAQATWESSFVGAVAIPTAMGRYAQLYRELVGQLLDDPAFRAAAAAR